MEKTIYVTSPYGWRTRNGKRELHKGIDIRSWNFETWQRIPFRAPEDCRVEKIGYSKKWGENIRIKLLDSGNVLTIRHIDVIDEIKEGDIIEAGTGIGLSMRTDYMRKVGAGEHFHIELNDYQDPTPYFREMGYTIL